MNRWLSHLCSNAVMSTSTKSALLQADYQDPDCFPEQQAAINEDLHLSLRPWWYSLGTEQMCPGLCPPRGAEGCRCGIIHLRPFHSGPGVKASAVRSDSGTLLGSLGSSICATAQDLNKKLHWNKKHRIQKQARKNGVCNFLNTIIIFLNATCLKKNTWIPSFSHVHCQICSRSCLFFNFSTTLRTRGHNQHKNQQEKEKTGKARR